MQWFGDLVTPAWWDDIWLNEGFASYFESIGVDNNAIAGEMRLEKQFVGSTLHSVMVEDSLASSRPVYLPVSYTAEINALFDSITYDKVRLTPLRRFDQESGFAHNRVMSLSGRGRDSDDEVFLGRRHVSVGLIGQ